MKKQLGIVLAAVMLAGTAAGCSTNTAQAPAATTAAETTAATEQETSSEAAETEAETTAANVEDSGYKTGLAIVSSLEKSKEPGDKDGTAQVDSVAAAVVLDADGKIVSCALDTAQSMMAFTKEGKVADPLDKEFQSKKELGDAYGMKAASKIGKEWYEQAAALEEYVIGKTVEEVKGIAVSETNVPTDADLAASVSIKIGDYVEAISEAAEGAKSIGTGEGDKLGLGIVTNMSKSKDAADGKDGQCQAYSTYTLVTTDADGKITAAVIDCTQGTVTFDAAGAITADLTAGVKTKRQLGDAYGMKGASGIGKEWFEQAAAMESYVKGKTLEEVKGIAVDADNKPTDADLASSVTISIGDYQTCIEKAVNQAK